MRRLSLVLGLLLALTTVFQNPPASAHTGYWRNTGNALNVRSGPGGSYEVIGKIESWGVIKAYGHRSNWIKGKVLATGQVGWMWRWNFHASSYTPPADPPASGSGGSAGYCLTTYWGEYVCASPNVADAIRYWFGVYGIGSWWGFATASCESNFDIYAYNPASGVTGLFQFQPSTFYWQGGQDLYDPWDQSRIAAKMFASGLGYMFACAVLQGW